MFLCRDVRGVVMENIMCLCRDVRGVVMENIMRDVWGVVMDTREVCCCCPLEYLILGTLLVANMTEATPQRAPTCAVCECKGVCVCICDVVCVGLCTHS